LIDDPLRTRLSLLARLENPEDQAAWAQFVELYGGLVYGFARDRGLQDADAADLTQEVFLDIARTAGRWRYDPKQGPFRAWLYGVTRHKLARFLQRRGSQPLGTGDSNARERLDQEPSPGDDLEELWEKEFQQQLFRVACSHIRDRFAPATWEAFWRTAVQGESPAAVAADLGLSAGAVYVARSRVLARLTEEIGRMNVE
jgi:RNA polymerase sigma-70 factor (ECF subfamily)